MYAIDLDKNAHRIFAMNKMKKVAVIIPQGRPYNPHSPVVETIKRKS